MRLMGINVLIIKFRLLVIERGDEYDCTKKRDLKKCTLVKSQ